MTVDRKWILEGLKSSLEALSHDGVAALELAPPGSCRPDELALKYDNFASAALANFANEFTSEQASILRRVNELLSDMSGPDNGSLWTEQAVCTHPRWREVRAEARRAVGDFSAARLQPQWCRSQSTRLKPTGTSRSETNDLAGESANPVWDSGARGSATILAADCRMTRIKTQRLNRGDAIDAEKKTRPKPRKDEPRNTPNTRTQKA
jgi:hypothetical protein